MGASASHVAPRRGLARERRPLLAGRPHGPVRPAAFVVRAAAGRSGARWTGPRGARLRRRGAWAVGACAGRPWPPGLTGAAPGARAPRACAPGRGPSRTPAPGLAGARSPARGSGSGARSHWRPGSVRPGSRRSSVLLWTPLARSKTARGVAPPGGTAPRRRLSPSVTTSGSAAPGARRTSRTARPRRRGATVRPRGVLGHQVIVGVVSRRPECWRTERGTDRRQGPDRAGSGPGCRRRSSTRTRGDDHAHQDGGQPKPNTLATRR